MKKRVCHKIGLKAQKHQAQGNALGKDYTKKVALKGQKQLVINAFALSGRLLLMTEDPGRCPGLEADCPFRAFRV